jgi:hypothetical protein
MKASPSEWNNQEEEGGKGYVVVFKIQPSSTIKDSFSKTMSCMSIERNYQRTFNAKQPYLDQIIC